MKAATPHRADPSTDSPEVQLSALRAEQVSRWRAGERPLAEEFLARHPEVAADLELAMVLVYGEVLLREKLDGAAPGVADYCRRFPSLAEALAAQFEVHRTLSTAAALPSIPGYEIVRELGRGGMGVVYLARETALDRQVAVKVLLSGQFAAESARRRFRTEAEAAARLKHPHIVEVHAFGEFDGRPFLVLEYVPGGNLDQRLDGTPLDPQSAAALVRVLADAVHHAHSAGTVHRDLKPANVLLQKDERGKTGNMHSCSSFILHRSSLQPKIADFGLAKQIDAGDGPTATSQILGTPSYMAPEQAGSMGEVGPASDIYSLGAILYECLAGRPPFKAATPIETLAQVAARDPVPPRSLNPAAPRDLETICLKCLAKEPVQRYSSAQALTDDLACFLSGQPVAARPIGFIGRSWRYAKRKPALASMGAILAIVIPTALITTTALYLRAEQRGRESLALRREAVENLSRLAVARSREQNVAEALNLHRACAEEYQRLADADVDPAACRLCRAEHISWEAFDLSRQSSFVESESVANDAIRAFEKCLREQPDSVAARRGLFEARFRRAAVIRGQKRFAEALPLFDALIAEAPEAYGHDERPGSPLRLTLRDLHHNRGSAFYVLGRMAESADAYEAALRYDDGSKWAELVILRACLLARRGRAAEAIETFNAQLRNPHLLPWNVFNVGCGYALAAVAADLPEAARTKAAESAIATFQRALAADPSLRNPIDTDPDLQHLRSRADFRALLSDN
jgi:serine/threonine protein kinase